MNEKFNKLAKLATEIQIEPSTKEPHYVFNRNKFAELIVDEACRALNPMLRDQISRGHGADLIKKYFGVEE